PFIFVNIQIDGPLRQYMDKIKDPNAVELKSQSFTLSPGTGITKKFGMETKSFLALFGADLFKNVEMNRLYGSQIVITTIEQKSDGPRTRDTQTFYLYRFPDAT